MFVLNHLFPPSQVAALHTQEPSQALCGPPTAAQGLPDCPQKTEMAASEWAGCPRGLPLPSGCSAGLEGLLSCYQMLPLPRKPQLCLVCAPPFGGERLSLAGWGGGAGIIQSQNLAAVLGSKSCRFAEGGDPEQVLAQGACPPGRVSPGEKAQTGPQQVRQGACSAAQGSRA